MRHLASRTAPPTGAILVAHRSSMVQARAGTLPGVGLSEAGTAMTDVPDARLPRETRGEAMKG